ncbi:MAG: dihydrodipicolinate synthase family protein [Gemmatimonadota bacterium]|nr:dihydrodipicolinate synthase family protein [Gemmatimonadota bacterium]MDH3422683.1 dihydrodipicolinate synthase family protein [Gemmatimonadota bacterium]
MGLNLGGTFLPVTTPFDPVTGDIDVVAFRSNLRHWFESPIRGVLIAGTTGESVLLDEAERQVLLEAAADVVPEDALIIVGTGVESTRGTVELSRRAGAAGADAVLVQPPVFFKGAMTPEVLARHYKEIADASPVPVLVYQVPLRMSTLDLPTGLVEELSRHPNIVGIKDSRGKLDLVGELVQHSADDFQVLVGSGALLYAALETGAVGGIVAVGLLATAGAAEITMAYREGRVADAGRIQERIAPVHQSIVAQMGVPGVKAALDLLGLRGGDPRAPLSKASESKVEEIREILATAGLLTLARV